MSHQRTLSDSGKAILQLALLGADQKSAISDKDRKVISSSWSCEIVFFDCVEITTEESKTNRKIFVLSNDQIVILDNNSNIIFSFHFKQTSIIEETDCLSLIYSDVGSSEATKIKIKSLNNHGSLLDFLLQAKKDYTAKLTSTKTARKSGTIKNRPETLKKGLNITEAMEIAKQADEEEKREKDNSTPRNEEEFIEVIDAGSEIVNGNYKRKGRKNKMKVFINSQGVTISCEIFSGQPGWIIGKAPEAFYGIVSASKIPPQKGWKNYAGKSPAPTINYYKGDSKESGTLVTMKNMTMERIEETSSSSKLISSNSSLLNSSSSSLNPVALNEVQLGLLEIYNDLITSEKKYISFLSLLFNNFLQPLEDDASVCDNPILSNEKIIAIFSNVGMLLNLHKQFLSKLESRDLIQYSQTLPVTFIQLQPQFRLLYSTYCDNLLKAWDVASCEERESINFSNWLNKTLSVLGLNKPFSHLLAVPASRLSVYSLYLKHISNKMPSSYDSFDKIQKALVDMNAFSEGCTDVVSNDNQDTKQLFQIWINFDTEDVELFSPKRKFFKEIECFFTSGAEKLTPATCYLFNDTLFGSTPSKSYSSSRKAVFQFLLNDIMIKHDGTSSSFTIIHAPDTSEVVSKYTIESKISIGDIKKFVSYIQLAKNGKDISSLVQSEKVTTPKQSTPKINRTNSSTLVRTLRSPTTEAISPSSVSPPSELLSSGERSPNVQSDDEKKSLSQKSRRMSVPLLDPLLTTFGPPINEKSYHRLSVYQEILDTEHNFLNDLRLIIAIYKTPLEKALTSGSQIINQEDINMIFGNIEPIIVVNSELLNKLEKDRLSRNLSFIFPSVFTSMERKFDAYLPYCSVYGLVIKRINSLSEENAKFRNFLDACLQKEESRNLDLVSFLIKPIQRVCKYPLFFTDLLKHTPLENSNYNLMQGAKAAVERVALSINKTMQLADESQKLLNLFNRFSDQSELEGLMSWHSRKIVKEVSIELAPRGKMDNRKSYVLVILTDIILICSQISSVFGGSSDKLKLKYKWAIGNINLRDNREEDPLAFQVLVYMNTESASLNTSGISNFIVWCSSESDKGQIYSELSNLKAIEDERILKEEEGKSKLEDRGKKTRSWATKTKGKVARNSLVGGSTLKDVETKYATLKRLTQTDAVDFDSPKKTSDATQAGLNIASPIIVPSSSPEAKKESMTVNSFFYSSENIKVEIKNFPAPKTSFEKARFAVYNEMIQTEIKYIEDLKILQSCYIVPLQEAITSNKGIISTEEMTSIFSNIEGILNVNMILLKKLEDGKKTTSLSFVIADTFKVMDNYFRMYFMYCNNYFDALEKIKELSNKEKRFSAFLKHAASLPECKFLDLGSYLIKPVQRICKYPLLFREILKHMESDHPNYEAMSKSEEKMKVIAAEVNERMRDRESASEVLRIYRELEGEVNDLVQPTRRLILKTEIDVSTIGNTEKKQRVLYIFNDLVLIIGKKSFWESKRLRHRFDLSSVDNMEEFDGYFTVKVSHEGQQDKYFFWFTNPIATEHVDLVIKWQNAISTYSVKKEIRRKSVGLESPTSNKNRSWSVAKTTNRRSSAADGERPLSGEVIPSDNNALKSIEALYSSENMKKRSSFTSAASLTPKDNTDDSTFAFDVVSSDNSLLSEEGSKTNNKGTLRSWKTGNKTGSMKLSEKVVDEGEKERKKSLLLSQLGASSEGEKFLK